MKSYNSKYPVILSFTQIIQWPMTTAHTYIYCAYKVWQKSSLYHSHKIDSFPGPAQLSIAISMEKRERAWYLFSCE